MGAWQENNWDPAVGSTAFADFCDALGTPDNAKIHTAQGITVSNATFNYAKYINNVGSSYKWSGVIVVDDLHSR